MAKITLKNVRLSFPSLWHKATFEGQETKYEATLLFPKSDIKTKEKLDAAIEACIKDNKLGKVKSEKICLKDGDEVDYDGYADHWSIKAANGRRPLVIDRDKSPLTEDDGKPYAGCYVNAQIDFWAQNNGFGKRVNANILAVQFVKDGEPFGSGGESADIDDFDDLGSDDDGSDGAPF